MQTAEVKKMKMNEEELLQRAAEEREQIFKRYDLGTDPSNEVYPWENPSFEVYHRTDKFGFIHDSRLPDTLDVYEIKQTKIEIERDKKWMRMMSKWDQNSEKLRRRVYKGIPNKIRWVAWKKLLKVDEAMSNNPGIYSTMLKYARLYSTETRQIDSDVNRQFRENIAFRERYSLKQKSLFNILNAYSIYNSELGYCQGMSSLAAVFLLYMDEEESFWALNSLMIDTKYAMHGLFIEGFPKLTRLLEHHDRIIKKIMRDLHAHFIKHNVDSILYSIKWFFCIFVERIPFSLCLRVWDAYLLDGERVVIAMAVTVLMLHKKDLLQLKDMDSIIEYLQVKLYKNFSYPDDIVMNAVEQVMRKLMSKKLDSPPAPKVNETPTRPLGNFVEPDFERKIGRRRSTFTENERQTFENVISRQESNALEIQSNTSIENSEYAVGDPFSLKTYRSFNSLTTSISVSTLSLNSGGNNNVKVPNSKCNSNLTEKHNSIDNNIKIANDNAEQNQIQIIQNKNDNVVVVNVTQPHENNIEIHYDNIEDSSLEEENTRL
ncbi:USP6 N-terminal-like protein [Condylostylus longicornis]|uniref:USP6 N-terminal-like protein n=1 Tax=Condylostylus longicornis TaxID=2530218 RepID=UPI00244E1D7D|nr:USP6 N-terminal-like protein [Condylostylus longicornis]